MRRSYKFRIYPNKNQTKSLEKTFAFCRFLYNSALEERISFHKKYDESLSYETQCDALPEIKEVFSDQTDRIYSQTLQQVLKQLDTSFKNFFGGLKKKAKKVGFPRFKNADRFRSILFPQSDLNSFGVKRLKNNKVRIYGLPGEVKVVWHREIQGKCKTVRILKQSDKYFLIASCDKVPENRLPKTGKTIALDLGLNSFITDNEGNRILHPKPYKTAKEKLAYLNRKLALKKRGSNNRKKAKQSLARAYEKISNIRDDFQHKLANKIIAENDTIIIEDLNIQKMMENKPKGKEKFQVKKENITDASWGSFAAKLVYKAESAGRQVLEVNPMNTSKTCSRCEHIKNEQTLGDREYKCEACGLELDRDHNAALNIYRLGMSLAAGENPPQKPQCFSLG